MSKQQNQPSVAQQLYATCGKEIEAFCFHEAELARVNYETQQETLNAKQTLYDCMAEHTDELARDCINVVLSAIVQNEKTHSTGATDAPAQLDDDDSVEITIHYLRHHAKDHVDSSVGGTAAVQQYDAAKGTTGSDGFPYPYFAGALITPFFLLGLFVSLGHVRAWFRRRSQMRIETSKLYQPVN